MRRKRILIERTPHHNVDQMNTIFYSLRRENRCKFLTFDMVELMIVALGIYLEFYAADYK